MLAVITVIISVNSVSRNSCWCHTPTLQLHHRSTTCVLSGAVRAQPGSACCPCSAPAFPTLQSPAVPCQGCTHLHKQHGEDAHFVAQLALGPVAIDSADDGDDVSLQGRALLAGGSPHISQCCTSVLLLCQPSAPSGVSLFPNTSPYSAQCSSVVFFKGASVAECGHGHEPGDGDVRHRGAVWRLPPQGNVCNHHAQNE